MSIRDVESRVIPPWAGLGTDVGVWWRCGWRSLFCEIECWRGKKFPLISPRSLSFFVVLLPSFSCVASKSFQKHWKRACLLADAKLACDYLLR